MIRYNLTQAELTPDLELSRAIQYLHAYLDALKFGTELPDTELQPADDLAILMGQVFVNQWKTTGDTAHLFNVVTVLEYASSKSKHSYQIRLLLVRIYRLLGTYRFSGAMSCCTRILIVPASGAPSLALEHYRAINIKQVQNDTLSHFILSRVSTFSLSSMGDLTYSSECLESSQIYMANSQEVNSNPNLYKLYHSYWI